LAAEDSGTLAAEDSGTLAAEDSGTLAGRLHSIRVRQLQPVC
jgi:hypothetical protein